MASVILAGVASILVILGMTEAFSLMPDIFDRDVSRQCSISSYNELRQAANESDCFPDRRNEIKKMLEGEYISSSGVLAELIYACDHRDKYMECMEEIADNCPFKTALTKASEQQFEYCDGEIAEWIQLYSYHHREPLSVKCMEEAMTEAGIPCVADIKLTYAKVYNFKKQIEAVEQLVEDLFGCLYGKVESAFNIPECTGNWRENFFVFMLTAALNPNRSPGAFLSASVLKDVMKLISQND